MFDHLISARGALQGCARDFDASSLSDTDAARMVDELGAIRRVVDGMLAQAAKRVADAQGRDAAASIARTLGVGVGEVRATIDTATKLGSLPVVAAAVRDGKLSAGQARLIVEAASANPASAPDLVQAAERGLVPLKDACVSARAQVEDPAARAARQRRMRSVRMWTDAEGMLAGQFRLTPEVGGQIRAVIETEVQRIFRARRSGRDHEPHEAYAADAFAKFVLGDDTSVGSKGARATVHVIVDHGALVRGGPVDGEACEIPGVGPVDISWVRGLLGTAFLTAVIKRGKDLLTVAHLGRHVPAEVQTALLVAGRECDIDGCHQRGYLERDHVHDHARGGTTAYSNLGWLCYQHHRLKSSGWQIGPRNPDTRKRTLRAPPGRAA